MEWADDLDPGFEGEILPGVRVYGSVPLSGGCWWVEPDLCSACAEDETQ